MPEALVGIAKLAAAGETLEVKTRGVTYRTLPTRRLLNRVCGTRVFFQWSINPYRGCEYGCHYCYARYTHEFLERRAPGAFQNEIFAKEFSPAALSQELRGVRPGESIAIGTATDPYQPAERRYGLTRRVLEGLRQERGRSLWITTKSDLVARDIDLLQFIAEHNALAVSLTVTTTDRNLARLLEPYAPRPDLRLQALRQLRQAGIVAGVLCSPILPLLNDDRRGLAALAEQARAADASFFGGGVLYLQGCARRSFFPFLREHFPALLPRYQRRFAEGPYLEGAYPQSIAERMERIRQEYGLAARAPRQEQPTWEGGQQLLLF